MERPPLPAARLKRRMPTTMEHRSFSCWRLSLLASVINVPCKKIEINATDDIKSSVLEVDAQRSRLLDAVRSHQLFRRQHTLQSCRCFLDHADVRRSTQSAPQENRRHNLSVQIWKTGSRDDERRRAGRVADATMDIISRVRNPMTALTFKISARASARVEDFLVHLLHCRGEVSLTSETDVV